MTIVSPGRESGSRPMLIKGAGLLTLDPALGDFDSADIHVRDGRIVEVAPELAVADAEVIDASAMIAMPGFVDAHRHLWEGEDLDSYFLRVNKGFAPVYTADDTYLGTLVGALGALEAGVTTVFDWAHVQNSRAHTDASIAALRESGLRTVFGFGPGHQEGAAWPDDVLRLRREEFASDDQLVTLALAGVSPESAPAPFVKRLFGLAREAEVVISVHAGINGMARRGEIERLGREGMLGPDVQLVHCNTLSPAEWRWIADTGTSVAITPGSEMQMGQGVPPIQPALDVGYRPSLGVDVETSAPNDMWTQMRLLFALQRMQSFEKKGAGGPAPTPMTMDDVLECAVTAGAKSARLDRRIGSLTPGKDADLILLRADMLNVMPVNDMRSAVVLNMDARNVDTVMVAGRIVKRHGRMIGVDVRQLGERLYAARERVYEGTRERVPSGARRLKMA